MLIIFCNPIHPLFSSYNLTVPSNTLDNRLSSVIVENRDIFELIPKYDSKETFFYLDPPYIQETRSSNTTY